MQPGEVNFEGTILVVSTIFENCISVANIPTTVDIGNGGNSIGNCTINQCSSSYSSWL